MSILFYQIIWAYTFIEEFYAEKYEKLKSHIVYNIVIVRNRNLLWVIYMLNNQNLFTERN